MAYTREEIQQKALQLQQAGAPSAKIRQFVELASQDIRQEDDSFFSRIKRGFGERVRNVEQLVDRPQRLGSKAFQLTGQAAGSLLDIGFEAAKSGIRALPGEPEKDVATLGRAFLDTDLGMAASMPTFTSIFRSWKRVSSAVRQPWRQGRRSATSAPFLSLRLL